MCDAPELQPGVGLVLGMQRGEKGFLKMSMATKDIYAYAQELDSVRKNHRLYN